MARLPRETSPATAGEPSVASLNSVEPPTRVRQTVVALAASLAVLTYVDRVCIAQAAPYLQQELQLSASQMGVAFSVFSLAYGLFEVPGGWLGDWVGPRKVLMRIVLTWSFFTAATGYAWNFVSLVIARFLFGVGEAGCFPNLTKALMIWLPPNERTRGQALLWLFARLAGAGTPLVVMWVMTWVSWRNTFVLFGAAGVGWAVIFHRSFRDNPRDHPKVNAAELALLAANPGDAVGQARVPWRRLLASRSMWLLLGQYFCLAYGWFFYVSWLPTYLRETRGLELNQNAFMAWLGTLLELHFSPDTTRRVLIAALAGIPLLFGAFGCVLSGWLTPLLVPMVRSVTTARRTLALAGFTGASVLLVLSFYIRDPLLAMLAMGMASLCNDLTMPGTWNTCMDVGGRYAGTVAGSMNMMSGIGASIAPLVVGFILDHTHRNWSLTFWISGVVYFLGGLCWLGIDPVTPIAGDTAGPGKGSMEEGEAC